MARKQFAVYLVAFLFCLAGSMPLMHAAEPDPPAEGPVDASNYAPPAAAPRSTTPHAPQALIMQDGYRSETLRGDFLAQWMVLKTPSRSYLFWGARALSLDQDSPLRNLGLKPGDVVTRIDGIGIANNMIMNNGVWQIPQMEQHYGISQIRFIKQGSRWVQNGDVRLDNPRRSPHRHGVRHGVRPCCLFYPIVAVRFCQYQSAIGSLFRGLDQSGG